MADEAPRYTVQFDSRTGLYSVMDGTTGKVAEHRDAANLARREDARVICQQFNQVENACRILRAQDAEEARKVRDEFVGRRDAALAALVRTAFGIETFERRNSDHLDFYMVGILTLKNLLDEVYEAGFNAGQEWKEPI